MIYNKKVAKCRYVYAYFLPIGCFSATFSLTHALELRRIHQTIRLLEKRRAF